MSQYVDEKIAQAAHDYGIKIGETEPSRETKGSWWEVFLVEGGDIIACVMTDWGVSCGEKILPDEVKLYVDDVEASMGSLAILMALSE